jgi:RNA polymerase sigma factor (sigma-70 family)
VTTRLTNSGSDFAPTRWTLVLKAQGSTPEAHAALGDLCAAYYQPVLRFLRREGRDEDTARELAQEFFSRILARGSFDGADPGRGRFRSYLLGALKHFLADQRKHDHRLKRGGGVALESVDALAELEAEPLPASLMVFPETASELSFDREWALAIMARALSQLQTEFAGEKAEQFEVLKPWLMGLTPALSQPGAARALGVSEGAVKVMIHRLRKRFRDAVRSEIAQTLRDPSQVEEELRHLIEALAGKSRSLQCVN